MSSSASTGLAIGGPAPDFSLRDQFGQQTCLSSFRGTKAVAIFLYAYAFSGVCTSEMAGIRDRRAEFLTFDTEVLAISCDPIYSLRAFADQDGPNFPLLYDFWPHGEVSRAYDVFGELKGCPRRSSYVVEKAHFGGDRSLCAYVSVFRARLAHLASAGEVPGRAWNR